MTVASAPSPAFAAPPRAPTRPRVELLALALVTLLGAALRAYRLDAADLWLDEGNTVLVASQPLSALFARLRADDVHPPLFYLLVKLPLALSWSELALRALPWLFGVLAIPLVYLVAHDLGGSRAALAAAALAAAWAPLVIFSQEGRMYSLLALLELLATWALARALEGGGRRWWGVWVAASTLALYTHNLAGLFLLAQLAVPLLGRRHARPALLSTVLVGVLYLPWLPSALAQTLTVPAGNVWLGSAPPLWLPLVTLVNLLLGTEVRNGLLSPRFAVAHAYLLAAIAPLAWFGWRRLAPRPHVRRAFAATFLLPPLLALALSQVSRIYVDKTFLVGALLVVVVLGLTASGKESAPGRATPPGSAGVSPAAAHAAAPALRLWPPRRGLLREGSVSPAAVPAASVHPRQYGASPDAHHVSPAAPLLALALVLAAQLWAVTQQWQTPHEEYAALVRDLEAARRPQDQVSVVPSFLSRPLQVYLARAGAVPALRLADAPAVEAAFDGDAARVWVVTGGVWVRAVRPDAAREFPHPPQYRLVWQRAYPDDGLLLLCFDRGA